ncbi:MAG: DNA polymerase I [Bacilli bacterium]|nr:DNA polymerase I [Bacilli bacterium]
MNKIILVDGNNLLFRSYFATAYTGNLMINSKGFPTNALYGFTNMINKIIKEEKPTHIMVAFDKGKTFRHDKYDFYKQGRLETPDELKKQFSVAKEMLTLMGIKYYEIDNYEADDIIGTLSKKCEDDPEFEALIISSDKDLLQLVSDETHIKLLKQKDYIYYDRNSFVKDYGIEPINIIDLKALMGDSSDNIPGVKGIGEKTALKLLVEYKNLDGVYNNIDSIKGSVHDKLVNDKDNAYMSYEIATIYRDVPLDISITDTKYLKPDTAKLNALYEELEFYSFLKKEEKKEITEEKYLEIDNFNDFDSSKLISIFLELDNTNYHKANIQGLGIYDGKNSYYMNKDNFINNINELEKYNIITYDAKRLLVVLKKYNVNLNIAFDTMVAAYLLEYNIKEDAAYLANQMGYDIPFYENIYTKKGIVEDLVKISAVKKARFIYETKDDFMDKISKESMENLFYEIELPLTFVLADMEYNGINVSKPILEDMGEEIKIKISMLEREIYNYAGEEFNIASPIQLGNILFEKLELPHGKKGKTGYSTAQDVLEKLRDKHPIIDKILEYRMLSKLYSTYIEGLIKTIDIDNKIHTIYTQTLTRTGRLSSIEPNLQNIPVRNEYGKLIRKAFLPSTDCCILSSDYSQVELRILAHIADEKTLQDAFNNDIDIHTKTASDIFNVPIEGVTKDMRRMAKAVNFGIIYGISGFGLSENTGISPKEAKKFIDNYLSIYPGIKKYMDSTIERAHEDLYVKTLFNRKRTITDLNNKNYLIRSAAERMSLNTPIQGTSADIIKKAMVNIYNRFKKENIKSKMILQVHDELIFDCLNSELDKVKNIVCEEMENVIELKVPLKVDIETGSDWYQAK